jgi:hypothetical protein
MMWALFILVSVPPNWVDKQPTTEFYSINFDGFRSERRCQNAIKKITQDFKNHQVQWSMCVRVK